MPPAPPFFPQRLESSFTPVEKYVVLGSQGLMTKSQLVEFFVLQHQSFAAMLQLALEALDFVLEHRDICPVSGIVIRSMR